MNELANKSMEELLALAEHDLEAQLELGFRYFFGRGVPQDTAQAVAWYRKAAEQGASTTAQVALGYCCRNGWGVEKDEDKAADWFRAAAKQGNPTAIKALNEMGIDEYES